MKDYDLEDLLEFSNKVKEVRADLSSIFSEAGKFLNKTDYRDLQRAIKKIDNFRNKADNLQYDLLKNVNETHESLEDNYNIKNLFYGDKAEI